MMYGDAPTQGDHAAHSPQAANRVELPIDTIEVPPQIDEDEAIDYDPYHSKKGHTSPKQGHKKGHHSPKGHKKGHTPRGQAGAQ